MCGAWVDISETIPQGTTSATMTWEEIGAIDNCGPVTLQSRSHTPGSSFASGTTQVTYEYADDSGNTISCNFNVIISLLPGMFRVNRDKTI